MERCTHRVFETYYNLHYRTGFCARYSTGTCRKKGELCQSMERPSSVKAGRRLMDNTCAKCSCFQRRGPTAQGNEPGRYRTIEKRFQGCSDKGLAGRF